MVNRWADKQLKNWEAALISLEAGWHQFNQATRGLPDALDAGMPISSVEKTYALNWDKVWQAIASNQIRGPQSYQLWEWWFQGQTLKHRLQQLRILTEDYIEETHHWARQATEFWLGFDQGKTGCRTSYIENTHKPLVVTPPTPYQKGEILGWHYATVKQQIQERLECCHVDTCQLFTWG